MKTTIETTQDIINICTKSSQLQREGNLNYFYVYVHYTTKMIPFYIGQGSHNRAYKERGRSKLWYNFVQNRIPIIKIIKSELSFEESITLEKELILKYKDTLINTDYGHSPNESFPVLCFTREGIFVKKYNSAEETLVDGFNPPNVRSNCGNWTTERSTHRNYVWCYEKDYEIRKETMFIMGKTVKKAIEVIFPNGIIKTYTSINSTKEDGLLPSKVREVLIGTRKFHKNCSYRFI